jgi:hypothetical protein
MPIGSEIVRLSGKTGSDRHTVKSTRMTQLTVCTTLLHTGQHLALIICAVIGVTKPGALYFDFETNLHDLRGWNSEIRRREIGVEVHGGEQGFSPDRHA